MMRRAALLCGLAGGAAAQNVGPRGIMDYSCGNCWKEVAWPNTADHAINQSHADVRGQIWQKGLCRTGSGDGAWIVRNDTNGSLLASLLGGGDAAHGYIAEATPVQAQSMSIANMKLEMGDEWHGMFCRSYLDKYKDGSTTAANPYGVTGSGKACVRGPTMKDIKEADNDARNTWYKFGTSPGRTGDMGSGFFDSTNTAGHPWGYASSYAMAKGNPPLDVLQFGTGRDMKMADVPNSWCRYAMRDMFCHIAFPQVVGTGMDCKDCQQAGLIDCSGVCMAEGLLRAVNGDDCSSLFQVCNRRQPDADETTSSYVPPELRNGQAGYFLSALTNEYWYNLTNVNYQNVSASKKAGGKEMKTDAWCGLWSQGWGLASAGTGLGTHSGAGHDQCKNPTDCNCGDKTKSCFGDVMGGSGINGTWETAPFKSAAAAAGAAAFFAA